MQTNRPKRSGITLGLMLVGILAFAGYGLTSRSAVHTLCAVVAFVACGLALANTGRLFAFRKP